ncbi:MFS general substrate transporter [Cucurbitaria berberidis CBS 394.84]|uniref:MFS general substrate transporter n=1 Tax=Cucurbitaria berberidis CBS 394.84 TaxID=1168544 RepID=A0A9P4LD68_9PLEO|nr:MFS general substrate transporter [Cucurbitaria berberidis CBS 394.84]KAF1851526.1 MFS general substrate transporter [Cucurbitaria berberidis CBS 394.84]
MAGSADAGSASTEALSKPEAPTERRKVAPRTTVKRLPWLDGKTSRAVSTKPSARRQSEAKTPSQGTYPFNRRPSTAVAPKSTTKPTPLIRKKPMASPSKRRVLPLDGSSLSVATENRPSQSRRVSLPPKKSPPLGDPPLASVSRELKKRPKIVHYDDEELNESPLYDDRRRTDSLVPVPDQLERSITPDSIRIPAQHYVESTTTLPAFASHLQMPATKLGPGPGAFDRIDDRRTSNAVEDLESMVQEAIEIAEDAHDQDQVEKIYEIIVDAKDAIQEASGDPTRYSMNTTSPLQASSEDVEDVSQLLENAKGLMHPEERVNLQRDSSSFDWAYSQRKDHQVDKSSTSSLSSSDQGVRGRTRFGTRSDLLLPPQPSRTSPRDHVDFVLRPVARDQSRGRSRQRLTGDSVIRPRRRRHRGSFGVEVKSRSGHRQHRSSVFSQDDTSFDEEDLPAKIYGNELIVQEQAHHHMFSLRRHHRRQPIARNWSTGKKRLTAVIACINTALLGIIIGVYAGEVPRIQYYLADERHIVIVGNAVLYFGLAVSTFVVWPLALLHGRKPYVLAALALALPLQFPQAIVVSAKRSPNDARFRTGLLCSRAALGLVLGFANVNYITVLLDLFGASLQSKNPHQEFVVPNDVRRHGGGMGMWLGIWSWCWIGSLAIGFQVGAAIIDGLSPDWGFYVVLIIIAAALVLNILAPETRRAPYRRSVTEVYDRDENYITRRVSRGECKLHISTEGPKYWFEEVWAGLKLMVMMMCQPGFLVLSLYLGWIYTQIVLVIVLLGALLSRDYKWRPRFVGAGVMSIAIGAFLAIPLTKAGIFSRERKRAFRTDSMTFQKQVTWSSHLVRRAIFTLTLPLMGLAYTVSAAGKPNPYMVPIIFAGAVGFFSILAIAECHGLMMETFDTCDLQPGTNTRHRLVSMAVQDRRRRTNYTSFPRVTAGIFVSQTLAFIGAGVATIVGGSMTRRLGAQTSTGVTAGILFGLTILLTAVLLRFKEVQVIPSHTFGTRRDTAAWVEFKELEKMGRGADWKAVVIGNPSGKMRRMSVLELGSLSRWTEIRKLNFLLKGPRLGEEKQKRRSFRDSW